MTRFRSLVFGPAYLDRVLLVDRPLIDPSIGGVLDRGVLGRGDFDGVRQQMGEPQPDRLDSLNLNSRESDEREWGLLLHCIPDFNLRIDPLPLDWPGPGGVIWNVDHRGREAVGRATRDVAGLAWHDDLGGMGAGYAKALGGDLIWLSGMEGDATSTTVGRLLDQAGIRHRPIQVPQRFGEWTLLITSGPFGDKLAVCIRTLGDAEVSFAPMRDEPCDLLVAASMTNKRAASALQGKNASVRFFAPSIRNMTDVEPRISRFAKHIDILSCNALEWESLADREEVAWRVSILVVTDGPRGATIRFTDEQGEPGRIQIPAFPRKAPPADTNRAGEAFGSTFVSTLIERGWTPGVTNPGLIKTAAERASAASALVLDRKEFGFPTPAEIDEAIARGFV